MRHHLPLDGQRRPPARRAAAAARRSRAATRPPQAQRATSRTSRWRLSRFRDDSELCALNRDPRAEVPASPLLRAAVRAGLWAAERSGGLVDPTLVRELEAAGLRDLAGGRKPASLARRSPRPRRAGRRAATRAPRWRAIDVDDERGAVRGRPACGSTPAASARAWRRTPSRTACAATRASSWTAAVISPSAASALSCSRYDDRGRASAHRRARAHAAGDRAAASRRRASTCASGARDDGYAHHLLDPAHRPAGVDRADRRHRARRRAHSRPRRCSKIALLLGADGRTPRARRARRARRPRRRRRRADRPDRPASARQSPAPGGAAA